MNCAILKDYNEKFVGVVGHNPNIGSIFYKVTTKFFDNLLKELLDRKFYKEIDEDELVYNEEVTKKDSDFLEIALSSLEKYKVSEFYEDEIGELKNIVKEKFEEKINF